MFSNIQKLEEFVNGISALQYMLKATGLAGVSAVIPPSLPPHCHPQSPWPQACHCSCGYVFPQYLLDLPVPPLLPLFLFFFFFGVY